MLGQKAERYNRLPSSFFPDLVDELTIYQFDNAILWFCTTMSNAINETKEVKVGKVTKSVPVHDPDELFKDDYRMPRPPSKLQKRVQGAANLLGLTSDPASGVKLWRQKKEGEE